MESFSSFHYLRALLKHAITAAAHKIPLPALQIVRPHSHPSDCASPFAPFAPIRIANGASVFASRARSTHLQSLHIGGRWRSFGRDGVASGPLLIRFNIGGGYRRRRSLRYLKKRQNRKNHPAANRPSTPAQAQFIAERAPPFGEPRNGYSTTTHALRF